MHVQDIQYVIWLQMFFMFFFFEDFFFQSFLVKKVYWLKGHVESKDSFHSFIIYMY